MFDDKRELCLHKKDGCKDYDDDGDDNDVDDDDDDYISLSVITCASVSAIAQMKNLSQAQLHSEFSTIKNIAFAKELCSVFKSFRIDGYVTEVTINSKRFKNATQLFSKNDIFYCTPFINT